MKLRNIGGVLHVQVPTDEVRPKDYIEFEKQGMRIRQVKEVYRGRKRSFISFYPLSGITVFKKQKIDPREVIRAWRKATPEQIEEATIKIEVLEPQPVHPQK